MSEPPNNQEAEECVLGAMLMSNQAIDAVIDTLVAEDFYKPAHAVIYSAIVKMRQAGGKIDTMTIGTELGRTDTLDRIGGMPTLLELVINTPSTGAVDKYAEFVIEASLRRRLMGEASELAAQAADLTRSVEDVLDAHRATMATIGSTAIHSEPDDISVEEFVELHKDADPLSKWVIHGLIRKRHKLMLVAGESHGKSVLMRYIAICAAYGLHPFRHSMERPIRTLIVDLENPEDVLTESFEMILKKVVQEVPQGITQNRLWWRPAGINLRNRVDLAQLENVIRVRRPELVCLGPMYCAFEMKPGEPWETPARQVQNALKTLMVRYDFALIIEDHAPQADSSGKRPMRPYGSSFWRRWLDIGIGMEPINDPPTAFEMKIWKGRVGTDWPKFIERGDTSGSTWPWVPRWE